MAEQNKINAYSPADDGNKHYPPYTPDDIERKALLRVLNDFTDDTVVVFRSYNQFNNRTLYQCIDDWTKRWNGYIPPSDLVTGNPTSNIYLNFTRNVIIGYLAKVAMELPQPKILAVDRKTNVPNRQFADVLKDLNTYSLNEENGPARLLEIALECTTKGTGIVYEGYMRNEQTINTPIEFNAATGEVKYKKEKRVIFDNCYQRVLPLEDFFIANPYEPDVQKQPHVIWRDLTSYEECWGEFNHYPNWKYVQPGAYSLTVQPTTFYRNNLYTNLLNNQVEVLRYYNRKDNLHIIEANGVVLYHGPIPFKDGKYPFAKYIFEPFENRFFWGAGAPNKFMGEQDIQNTFINMMIDKTYGSLLPYGLSSDLDDIIEDDTLAPNKIRKVGDIDKWKFDTLPGVQGGEFQMFQTMINLAKENSGLVGAGTQYSPKGGKLNVRQVLLQQQEAMQKLSFNMNFLEDGERDRTILRLNHIMQFYTIPQIERITGKKGNEVEQLVYRDIRLNDVELSNGQRGARVIKLIDDTEIATPDDKERIADELSVTEELGELQGTPTEALAVPISMFENFNYQVQIVKNSSFERNQALEQAKRLEFAQWRLSVAQMAPVDVSELVRWVEESYDVDSERFEIPQDQLTSMQQQQAMAGAPQPAAPPAPKPQKQGAGLSTQLGELG